MSRRQTDEEIEAEDAAQAAKYKQQRECSHYHCRPVEWYWSGQIQTMECDDCGEREWRDENEH